jgi:hypothetical protein
VLSLQVFQTHGPTNEENGRSGPTERSESTAAVQGSGRAEHLRLATKPAGGAVVRPPELASHLPATIVRPSTTSSP